MDASFIFGNNRRNYFERTFIEILLSTFETSTWDFGMSLWKYNILTLSSVTSKNTPICL